MLEIILTDITGLLTFYGVFVLAYAANVVFSIFQNTKVFEQEFDKKKFLQGILKCLVFVLGSVLLVLAIDFAVFVFNKYGVVSEQVGDLVTVAAMLVTIGVAIVKYIKEAYQTFIDILTVEK